MRQMEAGSSIHPVLRDSEADSRFAKWGPTTRRKDRAPALRCFSDPSRLSCIRKPFSRSVFCRQAEQFGVTWEIKPGHTSWVLQGRIPKVLPTDSGSSVWLLQEPVGTAS